MIVSSGFLTPPSQKSLTLSDMCNSEGRVRFCRWLSAQPEPLTEPHTKH